ncbi:unnamed protein product, partial [marine sediment metagenome]
IEGFNLSPFAFNGIADCWIEKNKEKLDEFKKDKSKGMDAEIINELIENYKKAIYYYGRAMCRNEYFIERNIPKIAELRQEIEQIKQQKEQEPQSTPK